MTTPTIKQMRAWQRQLGSMERKADELRGEMPGGLISRAYIATATDAIRLASETLTLSIVAAKSDTRRQGFASMTPERVAELSRLAVEAKRLKKTV